VRVYHLLSAKHGLDDLKQRRLKVARFKDLNDPFELLSVELSNRADRRRFATWHKKTVAEYGVLCFSRSWKSPVLWSHYAHRHKGLCLGFDVPDSLLLAVTYLKTRSSFGDLLPPASGTGSQPGALFYTKFEHWQYEDEVRRVVRLDEADRQGGHYFWPFGWDLKLMEVVAGPRCSVEKSHLQSSLDDQDREVTLTKARLAFRDFEVVTQQRGFTMPRRRRTSHSSAARTRAAFPLAAKRGHMTE
jgi:hypothetical protein